MSPLRDQLHSARSQHLSARYSGDLADLLPAEQPRRIRWVIPSFGVSMGLTAAAAVVILLLTGVVLQNAAVGSHGHDLRALVPTSADLPKLPPRGEMAGAIKTVTPPAVPELLMDAKGPLETSGKFIVNIGKDLAHHADALFHMG